MRHGPSAGSFAYKTHSSEEAGSAALYCTDDPFWREFMARNSRTEDKWRTPSLLAWNHKQYGVLGEVVDVPKMRREFERYKDF